jgi:two-component system response regulator YesN
MAVQIRQVQRQENSVLQTVPFVCRTDVLWAEPLQVDVNGVSESLRHAGRLRDVAVLAVHGQKPFPIYPFLTAIRVSDVEVLHLLWHDSRSFVLTLAAPSIEQLLKVVENGLRQCCDFNVLAGLSGPLLEHNLAHWYVELERAVTNCNHCVLDRHLVASPATMGSLPGRAVFASIMDRLLQVMQQANPSQVLTLMDEIFLEIREQWWPLQDVAELCSLVLVLAMSRHPQQSFGSVRMPRSQREWLDLISKQCCKLDDILVQLKDFLLDLLSSPRESVTVGRSQQIVRVIELIQQEYASELDLRALASRVFLSPGHLSKRFKKETGMTVHEFIIHTRLNRAMELLQGDLGLKVYEVGARVGYPDATYFNKLFKRHVGMTPKEYRDYGGTVSSWH